MQNSKKDWQVTGNPVIQVPFIDNLVYNERTEPIIARLNEAFRGKTGIEYDVLPKKGKPISYSNTPRAHKINTLLMQEYGGDIRVLSPIELIRFFGAIPDKSATYADTNAVSIYPNTGPNEGHRRDVLKIIGKKSIKFPMIVMGLDTDSADNSDGFIFKGTDYMQAEEAPWLQKDGAVSYDPATGKIITSDQGIRVYTPNNQSGLRRLCRDVGSVLYAWYDYLLSSVDSGRVQIFQNPQGRAQDLDALVKNLTQERDSQLVRTQANYEKALRGLKTGKFE